LLVGAVERLVVVEQKTVVAMNSKTPH